MAARIKPGDVCLVIGGHPNNSGAILTVTSAVPCGCGAAAWYWKDPTRPIVVRDMGFFLFAAPDGSDAYEQHEAWLIPIRDKDGNSYGEEDQVVKHAKPVAA